MADQSTTELLSHAQQRVLLAELIAPGTADNLVDHVYLSPRRLDLSVLTEAVHRVVARHSSLRDRLGWSAEGRPVSCSGVDDIELEVVHDPGGGTVPEIASRVTTDWWNTPYDLERDALFRVRLAHLPDGRDALCLGWHHLRCDGWSARLVADDLERAYSDWRWRGWLDGCAGPVVRPWKCRWLSMTPSTPVRHLERIRWLRVDGGVQRVEG